MFFIRVICLFLFFNAIVDAKNITIVTSFSVLNDIVKNIVKDKATVIPIVNNDQDTHVYELKPQDVQLVNQANLYVINGLGFENNGFRNILNDQNKLVIATFGLTPLNFAGSVNNIKIDPHAWTDPIIVAQIYVKNILQALIKVDKVNKKYYEDNAKIYIAKLNQLNNLIINELAKFNDKQLVVITTHDSFGYFAKRYNKINFLFVQGISTDSEASAKDVSMLITLIKKYKVRTIYLENMNNNKLITQIAKDTNVSIGGTLYSDSLSNQANAPHTYIDMIRYDINQIIKNF